ncbi:MAG: DUF1573 domain-containing protein [Crocinitomicaceae bacterium]
MKKGMVCFMAVALLAGCNGDEESEVTVNSDGTSSVVETVNPDNSEALDNNNTSSNASNKEITSIEYFETKHNFGNVFYPSDNKYTFKFKNTGTTPLVIESAKASCGCTVPNKPEKPIMPGDIGELDVIFRPKNGQVGQEVTKKVTVTANTNPRETYLEITANVMEAL